MKVQCVERFADLAAHHAAWNALVQQSPTNTVFQTFEWFASWWEAFGRSYALRVFLGFEGDTLAAVAPLVMQHKRWYGQRRTCLTFASVVPADYLDLLYRDTVSLRGLISAIRTDFGWDVLDLERIPADSPTASALKEVFPGWRGTAFSCDVASSYVFGPECDGSDILKKKSIKRHINKIQKAGALEVRHLTDETEITAVLEDFFAQHIERRALTAAPSLFRDPRERQFYYQLTRRLTPQRWVLFTAITLNGEPVAFHYGFTYGQKLLWYKPSFSPSHAEFSPGEVLIAELFRYCRAQALTELDFTVGAAGFKDRFTNTKRYNVQFQTFHNSFWQQVGHADRAFRERAKRVRLVHQVRAAWSRFRQLPGAPTPMVEGTSVG